MSLASWLTCAAVVLSLFLAAASIIRKKPSVATWCFFTGMVVLAIDSLLAGSSLRATSPETGLRWVVLGLVTKSLLPGPWLGFSLTYSRGDARQTLLRWRIPLALFALLPPGLSLIYGEELVQLVPALPGGDVSILHLQPAGTALNVILLVALVLALTNLEQTFRSAVGTMRWRIKYVFLGLAVIFGAQLYVRSQALVYSALDPALSGLEASGVLIGALFLTLAYRRTRLAEIDVYPSRAVLRSSFTILIAGAYLLIVGVLAQSVRRFGGAESFQLQVVVVLLGMAGLAVLLLSDRLRQRVRSFVGRHFRMAQHDSARIWTECSRRLAEAGDEEALCRGVGRLVSETFEVLSVTVWLLKRDGDEFLAVTSTSQPSRLSKHLEVHRAGAEAVAGLRSETSPFNLDEKRDAWAGEFRELNPSTFPSGGDRWCVPLRAGEQNIGAILLADRVNGTPYTTEDVDLLQCIADQATSVLLKIRLGNEVARARELEAFRTMSAFFVHDLKNAAASLNLMLKNLPVHFEEPEFREDALRTVGNSARRIEDIINRLGALRQRPAFQPVESDLNLLVNESLCRVGEMPEVEVSRHLAPLPPIFADPEQVCSVVINLIVNARDAVSGGGRIEVRTQAAGGGVILSVTDNGCGMSRSFLRDSLFRPFCTTKKKGLGIGMFQARTIVEAHGGSIAVESEHGKGTTVRVHLPAGASRGNGHVEGASSKQPFRPEAETSSADIDGGRK